jgi:hypothetical protein
MISSLKYKLLFSLFLCSPFLKADLYDLYYDKEAPFLRILPSEVQCLIAEKFLEAQLFPFTRPEETIGSELPKEKLSIAAFAQNGTILLLVASRVVDYRLLNFKKQADQKEFKGHPAKVEPLMSNKANAEDWYIFRVCPEDKSHEGSCGGISSDSLCKPSCIVLSTAIFQNMQYDIIELSKLPSSDKFCMDISLWTKYVEAYGSVPEDFIIATLDFRKDNYVAILKHEGENSWQSIRILKHPNAVYSASLNDTQNKVITMSADGKARIWDLNNSVINHISQKRITLEQLLFLRLINVIYNRGWEVKLEEIALKLHEPLSLNLPEGLSVNDYLLGILESFGDEVKQELINRYEIVFC